MALIHDVIDSDVRFIIDPVTRTISNQGSKKLVLTRGDHNSERFTFEIPRYVEGHDMSLCNVVRIHFINTDSRTREEIADIYEPDDASLLDTDDQLFTFSWLIERTATSFAGPLAFAIEFQCVVDGTVVYSWRTAANSTITIVNGINNANSTDVDVDELPTDIYATIRVATVASMIHDVIDSDVRFVIDPITRTISNQGSKKLMLIRGDHKSERFTFEIPRLVEGHDMSLCNVVRIHYINTNSKTRSVMTDVYEPTDMHARSGNIVTFSWLIGRSATTFAGTLAFSIEFQCVVDDVVEYSWHTGINNTIAISDGISNTEVINEEYSDILTIWWERLYSSSELPIEIITSDMFKELGNRVQDNTLYILEDDPTLEEIEKVIEDTKAFEAKLTEHLKQYNTLNTSMAEHVKQYTELDKNMTEHFENYENLLTKMTDLEKRVSNLEKGSGSGGGGENECEHDWVKTVVEPTCSAEGYSLYTCKKCGDSYKDSYTDPMEHNYVESVVTDNTCTEPAIQKYVCSRCNAEKPFEESDIVRPALGHQWIEEVVIDNTCTTPAYQKYRCPRCTETKQEELSAYPPLGHDWSYYQDPSAEETGWARKCAVCDTIELDVEYVCTNGGEHKWVEEAVIDNTCTAPAYQKYRCSVCNKTKEEELDAYPALGHNYVESVVTDNTCTEPAIQKYVCSRCNAEKPFEESDIVRPALGHNYVESVVTDNTCTEPAIQKYVCRRCNAEKPFEESDIVRDPLGHSWGDPIYDVEGCYEPTCTETGRAAFICDRCKAEKQETVPALQHDLTEIVTLPTCTEKGYTTKKCARDGCDYSFVDPNSYVDALGHNMTFNTSKEPTCTESGYVRFKCTRCDHYDDTTVDPLGHSWGDPIYDVIGAYEPTCITPGYAAFVCSRCKAQIWDNVPATGDHSWGEAIYDIEGCYKPTCTEAGRAAFVCSKCEGEKQETVPALQHDLTEIVTLPTCTEKGYTTKKCTRDGCDYSFVDPNSYVDALGHSWGDPIYDDEGCYEPTCTEAGYAGYVCSRCEAEKSETVPALQHELTEIVTEPTCTEQGYTTKKCTRDGCDYSFIVPGSYVDPLDHNMTFDTSKEPTCTEKGYTTKKCTRDGCDYSFVDPNSYVDALGHSWGEAIYNVEGCYEPTCTEAGRAAFICDRCEAEKSETVPALQHELTEIVTEPTCTEQGYTTKKCTRDGCDYSFIVPGSYVDPLPHTFVPEPDAGSSSGYAGVCSKCGYTEYDYWP